MLKHDMTPREPYPPRPPPQPNPSDVPPQHYPHLNPQSSTDPPFRQTKASGAELPPALAGTTPEYPIGYERARRRLENNRGTLGDMNLDGSLSNRPRFEASLTSLGPGAFNQSNGSYASNTNRDPPSIFFGESTGNPASQRATVRHGPGLQAVIYSDTMANMERRRAQQQELAYYEKIQLEERERMKRQEKLRSIEEEKGLKWPFGAEQKMPRRQVDLPPDILHLKTVEKERAEQYARDLSQQIEERERAKRQDRQQSLAADKNNVPVDPISLQPLPAKPSVQARRIRPPPLDERKDVYPLAMHIQANHNGTIDSQNPAALGRNRDTIRAIEEANSRVNAAIGVSLPGLGEGHNYQRDDITGLHEPKYGRKRTLNPEQSLEKLQSNLNGKMLLKDQAEELKAKQEHMQQHRKEEIEMGKKFAENYPWHWGQDLNRRGNAKHKSSDIMYQAEPIDRDRALQYQHDLDQIVQERRQIKEMERKTEIELGRQVAILIIKLDIFQDRDNPVEVVKKS
ncbi:hypothetical protein HDU76_003845 [Blyttiomyces sp. JEL0837]|nr:hypothetical protein HDU76_003845 [Blyttiomyces sp. JEL0837]